jgi:mRNA interferase RelE/StbE
LTHRLIIPRSAEKEIEKLPSPVRKRVHAKIKSLTEEPYQPGTRKIAGHGIFRVRVGDYRIVYEVDDSQRRVTISRVRHRSEAYR